MSILDERKDYLKNPYFKGHEYSDFTPFYVTIAFCTVLGGILFILNIVFCWCSRHREYWQNHHTGESHPVFEARFIFYFYKCMQF